MRWFLMRNLRALSRAWIAGLGSRGSTGGRTIGSGRRLRYPVIMMYAILISSPSALSLFLAGSPLWFLATWFPFLSVDLSICRPPGVPAPFGQVLIYQNG